MPQIKISWDFSKQVYSLQFKNFGYTNEDKTLFGTCLAVLKTAIPRVNRDYDEATKTWYFEPQFLDTLVKLLEVVVLVTVTSRRPPVTNTQQGTQSNPFNPPPTVFQNGSKLDTKILEFFRILPFDAVQSAYKKAVIEFHPDKNQNSSEDFQTKIATLNSLWDFLKKELYHKNQGVSINE